MAHKHGYVKEAKEDIFPIAHITVRVRRTQKDGNWFALFAGEPKDMGPGRALFTGTVERQMGAQLRKLADLIDEINDQQALDDLRQAMAKESGEPTANCGGTA